MNPAITLTLDESTVTTALEALDDREEQTQDLINSTDLGADEELVEGFRKQYDDVATLIRSQVGWVRV